MLRLEPLYEGDEKWQHLNSSRGFGLFDVVIYILDAHSFIFLLVVFLVLVRPINI